MENVDPNEIGLGPCQLTGWSLPITSALWNDLQAHWPDGVDHQDVAQLLSFLADLVSHGNRKWGQSIPEFPFVLRIYVGVDNV